MNSHALLVLEFPAALDLVAGHASSALGAARIRAALPRTEPRWIQLEHDRVAALRTLVQRDGGWSPPPIPDVGSSLERLGLEGAVLLATELLAMGRLLASSREARNALTGDATPPLARALLAPDAARLLIAKSEEASIARAVNEDGDVRDEASPVLRRVRRELRGSEGELVRILEGLMARLAPNHRVPDMSVTVRNGRYVIPVRRDARAHIGGIVHDTSSTGGTLFVEPPAAIEAGNRIRELEAEAVREVERILRELTDMLRPLRDAIAAAFQSLIELDSLYARARFAAAFACGSVEFGAASAGFSVIDGRHPLLVAQGIPVVPFDLALAPAERTLLVSGPNTGGKTVLLKALGLFAAMAQAGIPVPVGDRTRLCIFDEIFADIGDEQSISSSLSTFSAHLRNLVEVLRGATPDSLALIDELGSGTDPTEGAALGAAILEALNTRRTTTVATTHLGGLKQLATEVPGVVNASLQFDAEALAPSYRLIKGIPGRSYGLSIARRLNLPDDVLRRAEARLPAGERDVSALLAELEAREEQLRESEAEAAAIAEDVRTRARRIAEREGAVRERERNAEREARRETRRLLLEAREQVEQTIRELRQSATDAAEESAREARRRIEHLAAQQADALAAIEAGAAESADATDGTNLREGQVVAVASLGGRTARVLELRAADAVVAFGSVRMTVPRSLLSRAAVPESSEVVQVALRGSEPDVEARSEIDLRGMRAAEVEQLVLRAVDSAIRADLRTLRIIHGKGTGALRQRVAEMLQKEPRVVGFRLGAWNEGGAGVTIAELE